MNYFKILRFLQKGDKGLFDISVEEQKQYLDSLGEPKDDIDRSYKQYQCQNLFVPKRKQVMFNIAACFGLPFLVFYLLLNRLGLRKGQPVESIFESKGMLEIIPLELKKQYVISDVCWDIKPSLSINDLGFVWRVYITAPLQCYFTFKSLMNVARYSALIKRDAPKVIIRHAEFSFSSSLLTDYCRLHGVRHFNVMHGEKLFFIRDAFFHFDECFVWSDYYVNLFRSLKAEALQFRVALPPSMKIEAEKHKNPYVFADYKYYLALYSEEQIKNIVSSMQFAKREGKSVKYRPHPRYSNMVLLKKYVPEEEIEYPKDVTIVESISNLQYAVGSYTTVLSQAWFSGKVVILDDVTFEEQYIKLEKWKYFLSQMDCNVLSNCQI